MKNRDEFWMNDPLILIRPNKILEFVPNNDMNSNEKMNAMVRLSVYIGLISYFLSNDIRMMYIPVLTVILTIFINYPTYRNIQNFENDIKNDENVAVDVDGKLCQKPNSTNPFMNVMVTDYADNPNRLPACKLVDGDEKVKEDVERYFDHNLYKDVDDIYNKINSQRQFYTTPNTMVPNDRESFQKWCFGTMNACKSGDQEECFVYNDIRGNGGYNTINN